MLRVEHRSTEFNLRTGLGLALLLHLLAWVMADYRQSAVPFLATRPPPSERPLRFVFLETPESKQEPPPETERYAAQRHRAAGSASPPRPDAQPDPSSPGERSPKVQPRAPAAQQQARQPVRPAVDRTRQPEAPTAARATEARKSAEAVEATASRERPIFTSQALSAAVAQQVFAQPGPSRAAPNGVLDFDAKDFDFGPYAQQIYQIIKRNWYSLLRTQRMPPGMRGRTRLNFRIMRNGQVHALTLIDGSDWELLDRSALGSVELSDPLPPLPTEYPREDVGVTFSYYFNMPVDGS